jgi:hypothetical protein
VEPIDTIFKDEKAIIVYSDYIQILDHLTDPRFKLTDDPREAHIVWMTVDYYNVAR